VTEDTKDARLKTYNAMPDLHILTTMMDQGRYDAIKQSIGDTSYGFSGATLLSGKFPNEVDVMLRYITGSDRMTDFPRGGDKSIFARIRGIYRSPRMCSVHHSTDLYIDN